MSKRSARKQRKQERRKRLKKLVHIPGQAILYDGTVMPYAAYITSEHWGRVKARYRKSKFPQCCVVCDRPDVDLHHRTYKRLGHEWLQDLQPLCRDHHKAVHDMMRTSSRKGRLWGAVKRYLKSQKKSLQRETLEAPTHRPSRSVKEHDDGATMRCTMVTMGRGQSQARALA